MRTSRISSLVLLVCVSLSLTGPARAQSSAFTYQGQLKDGGIPADGSYNLVFKLFSASSGGSPIGTIPRNGVALTNGLINQTLDLGAGAFNGQPRWLEITVNGVLLDRQPLTAAPYALYALNGRADSGPWAAAGKNISNTNTVNVGIGTNAPVSALHVQSSTASSGDNTAVFEAPALGPHLSHVHWGTTGDWYIRSASEAGKVVLQDSGGAVGIGTQSPQTKLHLSDPVNSVSHRIETGAGTNAWTRVEFANGNGRWDIGTSRGFNHDVFYLDRPGGLLEFQLNTWGGLGLGIEPQAKLHLFDPGSVSLRIDSGGGTNAWSRVEFANGDGQWNVGTSRNYNGNQFYFHREGSPNIAFGIQPNGDAVFGGAIDIGYEIVRAEGDFVNCPAGKRFFWGGCSILGDAEIRVSAPSPEGNGWRCERGDESGFTSLYAYVICAKVK